MSYDKQKSINNLSILVPDIDTELAILLLDKAEKTIKTYCYIEDVTDDMSDVLEDLAIYKYNTIDRQGIESEGLGRNSISINQDIPINIKARLVKFRKKIRVF